jgi:hypothetical protein
MANLTHKLDPVVTQKVMEIFFMKLEIWVNGSLEIMHIFSISSYVENSGCYGNK